MNFTHAAFYPLDDGAGTAVVDALGNAPAGAIVGETTNLWANAGCMTVSKAAGAAGELVWTAYLKAGKNYLQPSLDEPGEWA